VYNSISHLSHKIVKLSIKLPESYKNNNKTLYSIVYSYHIVCTDDSVVYSSNCTQIG